MPIILVLSIIKNMAKNELRQEDQLLVLQHVEDTFNNYEKLSANDRVRLLKIFEGYDSFEQKKTSDWSSSFKVNKAHEIVNKVLPRIIAKNPRWIVSPRTDEFRPEDKFLTGQELEDRRFEQKEMALGIQDYLTYIFDTYNQREPLRLWAKNMLIYWNAYAKIKYKYETARVREEDGTIKEKVIWEYPTIDSKSWTDIYVDPRYVLLEDMPAIIEKVDGVRLADLMRKKDKYINLDKLAALPDEGAFSADPTNSKQKIFALTGIPTTEITWGVDKNTLTMKTYYGKYVDPNGEDEYDEKLYRITTVNDMIVIEFEEITAIPFEDIKCFDNTEVHYSTWYVEPILSLQDEINFKKNSASEYINNAINRSWIYSPNSGVDPRDLISRPNNIISTTKDAITAQNNLIELPHRNLPTDYFQEQNDLERQIQASTFTIDTTAPRSQQGLTDTATGIRVQFFEANAVTDEVRKHFEEWLEKLAYKLLECTFENMDSNIVIKKLWDEGYWEVNKELMKDALTRYSIKVEVNSSSFDDLDNRRADAIAFSNVLAQAAQQGVPVDLTEWLKDVISTFEKRDVDRFIKPELAQQEQTGEWEIEEPQSEDLEAAELTEQVAGGGLTTWL